MFLRKVLWIILLLNISCGQNDQQSDVLVTDVDHTPVKRQSIGNCWIYAQSTWLESLLKTTTSEDINVSESYWTWWHWHDQIVNSTRTEISTGGWWRESSRIIANYGFVEEAQFIPEESEEEMSIRQMTALSYMNTQLAEGGALATRESRTPENVRAQLDQAFGTDMAATEPLARSARETSLVSSNGTRSSLYNALYGNSRQRWNWVGFPRIYGEEATPSRWQIRQRNELLVRVRRALNDRLPVVMSLMIDFNALDVTDQTFKASTLETAGALGVQGGHMLVLHDYVVDNVPGYGRIGEGVVSDEMKEAALQGDIVLLKAKNSWGTNRPDRGLTDGYTRFDWDYLTSQLEWKQGDDDDDEPTTSFYTTLTNFVLPPGY